MTIITLPADVEGPLLAEAQRQGTTPEQLAVDSLRRLFASAPIVAEMGPSQTLFDFLSDYIGAVSGSTAALSEKCGERFADEMVEKQRRGRL